jgi:hypothetical protein
MQRTAREKAILRMAMADEMGQLRQGEPNTSGLTGADYPRMLYRATTERDEQVVTTFPDGRPREVLVRNDFGGLLCETTIAQDADEAEQLAAEGWDSSPQAAHGQEVGIAAVTTAKDDEIARLRAQVAALSAASDVPAEAIDKPRRGRPPSKPIASDSEAA